MYVPCRAADAALDATTPHPPLPNVRCACGQERPGPCGLAAYDACHWPHVGHVQRIEVRGPDHPDFYERWRGGPPQPIVTGELTDEQREALQSQAGPVVSIGSVVEKIVSRQRYPRAGTVTVTGHEVGVNGALRVVLERTRNVPPHMTAVLDFASHAVARRLFPVGRSFSLILEPVDERAEDVAARREGALRFTDGRASGGTPADRSGEKAR